MAKTTIERDGEAVQAVRQFALSRDIQARIEYAAVSREPWRVAFLTWGGEEIDHAIGSNLGTAVRRAIENTEATLAKAKSLKSAV